MLDPTMVATRVSHLRLCERAASKAGVAWMTPASQGDRINPTIGCSKNGYRRLEVHLAYIVDKLSVPEDKRNGHRDPKKFDWVCRLSRVDRTCLSPDRPPLMTALC